MTGKIIALLASMIFAASPVLAGDLKVTINTPEYSEADAASVVELFRRNCRPLGNEFWDDVAEVEVDIRKETAEFRLARGWGTNVHLAIKYSDHPKRGPAFASGAGVLAGHTLHYDIGGGSTPGYLAGKRSSQYLCGLSFDPNGEDVFQPVPEFSILDR